MDVMIKAFKCRTKASVREWGHKLLIFTFMNETDRDWHFDDHLFVVKSLTGSEQPSGVTITRSSFWARVYDLPIMCHTEATLISIAKRIGELDIFEPPDGLNLGYYLRFKVSIDITKPLMRGLLIKIKGDALWIPIKYEALPFYCFCCGLVGHNFRGYDSYDKNDCPDPTEMEYGPFLKASPIKKGRGPKIEMKMVVSATSGVSLSEPSTIPYGMGSGPGSTTVSGQVVHQLMLSDKPLSNSHNLNPNPNPSPNIRNPALVSNLDIEVDNQSLAQPPSTHLL
ncbi:hypothetical protein ACS0TY_019733 [Phlomoides rotata]